MQSGVLQRACATCDVVRPLFCRQLQRSRGSQNARIAGQGGTIRGVGARHVAQNIFQSDEEPVEFAARPKRNKTAKAKTMTMATQVA